MFMEKEQKDIRVDQSEKTVCGDLSDSSVFVAGLLQDSSCKDPLHETEGNE